MRMHILQSLPAWDIPKLLFHGSKMYKRLQLVGERSTDVPICAAAMLQLSSHHPR